MQYKSILTTFSIGMSSGSGTQVCVGYHKLKTRRDGQSYGVHTSNASRNVWMLIICLGSCSRVTSILQYCLFEPTVSILSIKVSHRRLLCKNAQNVVSQSVSQ